jgi:exopolyphosphatase/guanosine-5'-triphosphate,3'-diphosphate pyrophosphatase
MPSLRGAPNLGLLVLPLLACLPACQSPGAPAGDRAPAPVCVIDMGSNSFKRIVGTFAGGRYEDRKLEKRTLGVGDDLSRHGRISDAKLAEIEATLAAFRDACAAEGVTRVLAVGTAAFRQAPNASRAVEIAAKLGIPMEIASEERESVLAYHVASLGQDGFAVIDNGSRSIELASKEPGGEIRHSVFDLGYRVAWERFFAGAPSAAPGIRAFQERLREEAAKAPFLRGQRKLVGVEFEEMAEVLFPPAETEGRVFALAELQAKLREIAALGPEQFARLREREDIDRALPRLVVVATLAEEFGYPAFELTARELGTGLIIEAGRPGR